MRLESSSQPIQLDPTKTALVCIDLQQGILAREWHPRTSDEVLQTCLPLIHSFHQANALVVFVHVGWDPSLSDAPRGLVDAEGHPPGGYRPDWTELDHRLPRSDRDLVIHKRQWGAFEGTDLEQLLRRRGIDTIVLAGIATNMGVESTARQAFEKDLNVVLIEEAMSSFSAAAHEFAVRSIFPRIGRVRCANDLQWKIA
jgi:nicotinamidase-related amidase